MLLNEGATLTLEVFTIATAPVMHYLIPAARARLMKAVGVVGAGAVRGEVSSPVRVDLRAVSTVVLPLERFVLPTLELSLLTPPVRNIILLVTNRNISFGF